MNAEYVSTGELPEPLLPPGPGLRDLPPVLLCPLATPSAPQVLHADATAPWLRLLCAAWQSTPPGSLPSDDLALASLSGLSVERWQELRSKVLDGWVLCSDGRVYCRFLCAQVLDLRLAHEARMRIAEVRAKAGKASAQARRARAESVASGLVQRRVQAAAPGAVDQPAEARSDQPSQDGSAAGVVFDHWCQAMGKKRAVLDAKRRRLIAQRIADGYSVDELKAAIDGNRASPWHQGDNERKTPYNSLELILRDAEHVDRFVEFSKRPPKAGKPALFGQGGASRDYGPTTVSGDAAWFLEAAERSMQELEQLKSAR